MTTRRLPPGNRAPIRALARLEALDPPGEKLAKAARRVFTAGPVKDALSGTWLGHALHPLLTDVTIGAFTSALMLDWLGGERSRPAAQRLIGLGLLSTPPVVASGYSDWGDSTVGNPPVQRIGLVHGASNAVASALFAASYLARRRGESGRLLALAGGTVVGFGGYLGGHLSFAEGLGVDRTAFERAPDGWTAVLDASALAEGRPRCALAGGTPVLLVRSGGELRALSNTCSHRGGPLHEGELGDGTITCPLHGSVFDLADGALVRGPSAYPQPAWDARERDGRIEVRRR